MPINIKISISVIVAMVGMGVFFLEQRFGDMAVGVVALLLALFMVLSMWIFPETKGADDDIGGPQLDGQAFRLPRREVVHAREEDLPGVARDRLAFRCLP